TGAGASVTAAGNLTVGNYSGTSGTTTVSGNFAPGAFLANGGTVVHNGTGSIGSYIFNILNLSGAGFTHTASGAWTVTGSLGLAGGAGTFAPGNFTHSIAGSWNDSVINFVPSSGTIVLTAATPTVQAGAGNNFYNLTVQNGGSLSSNVTVKNDITISGGAISDSGNFTLTVGENWTNSVGASGFSGGTSGTVVFNDSTRTSILT